MGSAVIAICECGYMAESAIGGGMATFKEICYFPVYCEVCLELVEANLLAKPVKCPACEGSRVIPYDNVKLIGEIGENEIESWNMEEDLGRELVLTDGTYFCPSCEEFKLRFKHGMVNWD